MRRKEREDIAEQARAAASARSRRRFKVIAIFSPFLLVLVGAIVSAIFSQVTAQRPVPVVAPH